MRSGRTIAWAVFAAALLTRVGWVVLTWLRDGAALPFDDEHIHWQLASNLVHDGTLATDDGRFAPRMPAYPLFLAPFALFGDGGILLARLAQALLGAAGAAIAARLGRALGGWPAAWIAGGLVALDPYNVYFCSLLLTEALFTPLLLVFVGCCAILAEKVRNLSWATAGVALTGGLLILARPSAALLVPLAWGLVWWLSRDRRTALARVAWGPLVLAVLLLPWGLRNLAVLGSPAWLSANGGVTLYDAQGPQADGSSDQSFLAEMPELDDLGEVTRDRYLQQRALDQMRADPGRVAHLALAKVTRMWRPTPNVAAGLGVRVASAAYTVVTVLGALLGLVVVWRSPKRGLARRVHVFVWASVVYFTLLHSIYIGSVRYRIPLMPLLAVATAAVMPPRDDDAAATART
jgi:4-amino-4-deoxy-L-arabinose transferase-like glycosyltransferase